MKRKGCTCARFEGAGLRWRSRFRCPCVRAVRTHPARAGGCTPRTAGCQDRASPLPTNSCALPYGIRGVATGDTNHDQPLAASLTVRTPLAAKRPSTYVPDGGHFVVTLRVQMLSCLLPGAAAPAGAGGGAARDRRAGVQGRVPERGAGQGAGGKSGVVMQEDIQGTGHTSKTLAHISPSRHTHALPSLLSSPPTQRRRVADKVCLPTA